MAHLLKDLAKLKQPDLSSASLSILRRPVLATEKFDVLMDKSKTTSADSTDVGATFFTTKFSATEPPRSASKKIWRTTGSSVFPRRCFVSIQSWNVIKRNYGLQKYLAPWFWDQAQGCKWSRCTSTLLDAQAIANFVSDSEAVLVDSATPHPPPSSGYE